MVLNRDVGFCSVEEPVIFSLVLWALATSCPNLQLQQCIRIAVRELGHVGWGERDAVEKVTTLCIGGIGIVDREHDAVDAEG